MLVYVLVAVDGYLLPDLVGRLLLICVTIPDLVVVPVGAG